MKENLNTGGKYSTAIFGKFSNAIDSAGFVRTQLRRKRDDIFRFVIDRSVDSTNNRAERAIRSIVTYRKVSGGSRSDRGGDNFARVYSVLESDRKKGKLPFRSDPG
ncbi:MAG: IS66 family transposase [Thermodesulfobium sp.]